MGVDEALDADLGRELTDGGRARAIEVARTALVRDAAAGQIVATLSFAAVAGLQALDAGALADVAKAPITVAVLGAAGDVSRALAGEGVADEARAAVDIVAALDADAGGLVAEACGPAGVEGAGSDAVAVGADEAVTTGLADGAGRDIGGTHLARIATDTDHADQQRQQACQG